MIDPARPRGARPLRPIPAPAWPAWLVPLLLTLVAGALRLARLDYLGLRIDEGFTMTYARQPWRGVLGLDGFYSPHPPLYFSLAKVANLFVPEEIAARSVAAVAGTLTIPVLYALVSRLLDRRVATAAAALVTISPLHIQFSRDGRMYAPVVLLVAVTYLALAAYRQTAGRWWLPVYGAALVLAVYVDYSAAFGIAPQALLLLRWAHEDRRRTRPLLVTVAVAVALYAPWLPQIVDTVDRAANATARDDYLAASWGRIGTAVVELTGLDARAVWSEGGSPSPWDRWESLRPLLLLGLLPSALAGLAALALFSRSLRTRRRPDVGMLGSRRGSVGGAESGAGDVGSRTSPAAVVLALTLGPPVSAILASLISPGFAARTVMTSVLGWSVLAGAVFLRGRLPGVVRLVGGAGFAYVVAVSLLALPATYEEGRREQWRELAAGVAETAPLGKPVAIFSTAGMLTDMVDLYAGDSLSGVPVVTLLDGERETWTGAERWLDRGPTLAEIEAGALAETFRLGDPAVDAFWLVRRFGGGALSTPFIELGYRPVGAIAYVSVRLELWARSGAVVGAPIALGDLGLDADDGGVWQVSLASTRVPPGAGEAGAVLLDADRSRALTVLPAGPGLYLAETRVWIAGSDEGGTVGRVTIRCLGSDGAVLARQTNVARVDASDAGYRPLAAAVRCPGATTSVELVLDRQGPSRVGFRFPTLSGAPLPLT